jgi:outer membrane protein OmpA-like peptidoglycan-associated protein
MQTTTRHFATSRRYLIATLVGSLGFAAVVAAAQPAPALSKEQILSRLQGARAGARLKDDDEDDGAAKAITRPRPDPSTRLCEHRPARFGANTPAGDTGFRNLVARPSPRVDLTVEFDFGRDQLRPDGAAQLDQLGAALNDSSLGGKAFSVIGHTDAAGSADANDRLSCGRALAAKRYLVERHRIAPDRLVAMGMGSADMVNRANPLAAENRRVEIKVLAVP